MAVYFSPIFIYQKGKGTSINYEVSLEEQDPKNLVNYFNEHQTEFYKQANIYKKNAKQINKLIEENKKTNFYNLYHAVLEFWPMLLTVNILGGLLAEITDKKIAKKSLNLRKETDTVVYKANNCLFNIAQSIVHLEYRNDLDYLTFEEITTATFPKRKEINQRKNGYIYYSGNIFYNLNNFLKSNNIKIKDEESPKKADEIRGSGAFKGMVTGRVRRVFEIGQARKIKSGNVMVTPMTTPDFLPAMKKEAAIITDEGGITCHAAIIAREMKKPCIIGTKITTKVLKDGDEVEVDANEGIVRIIKRANGK